MFERLLNLLHKYGGVRLWMHLYVITASLHKSCLQDLKLTGVLLLGTHKIWLRQVNLVASYTLLPEYCQSDFHQSRKLLARGEFIKCLHTACV